jgi:hypothetical protein
MKLRFISPTTHGVIDYAAAIALVTAPFLLGKDLMQHIIMPTRRLYLVVALSANGKLSSI